jgi:hypothetical protein
MMSPISPVSGPATLLRDGTSGRRKARCITDIMYIVFRDITGLRHVHYLITLSNSSN